MLRFGVLGAGRIGKVHARTIAASGKAKVAYLADALPKAAADLASEVGAKVASVDEIIKAKAILHGHSLLFSQSRSSFEGLPG